MFLTACMYLLLLSALVFPFLVHPYSMGFLLVLSAFSISLSFSWMFSSWVGFILFLLYVGGLLVMFLFVISIMPDSGFGFSPLIFFLGGGFLMFPFRGMEGGGSSSLYEKEGMDLSQLFIGSQSLAMYSFLVVLLFIGLVVVVSVCSSPTGSLRGSSS
uniref:NADH dehydrogenase subunit 6 n=1 Tax=Scutopus robustus TaxID=2109553 RepID=A0A343YNC3_9MOLL|nr:NADH dehydrogenase subunit 6 [Scutopus robustus]AWL21430.1 NADH dehydrogenase subunit 6 [Scutopus robustus]